MDDLHIRRLDTEAVRFVKLVGELDLAGVGEVESHLASWGNAGRLVVDTTELTFVDCTGLRVLVEAREEWGPIVSVSSPAPPLSVFWVSPVRVSCSFDRLWRP